MKKLLISISVALLAIILCVAFSGCATNVSGKTYAFSEVNLETEEELSSLEQAAVNLAKAAVETAYKGSLTFNEDGTLSGSVSGISAGYWAQDGKNVSLYATSAMSTALLTLTASGSKLEYSVTQSGYTFSITWVKQ